jgi:hypothetical protein
LPIIKQNMKRKAPGAWVGPVSVLLTLDDGHLAMLQQGAEIIVEDGDRRYKVKGLGSGQVHISRRFDANDPRAARLLDALGLSAPKADE